MTGLRVPRGFSERALAGERLCRAGFLRQSLSTAFWGISVGICSTDFLLLCKGLQSRETPMAIFNSDHTGVKVTRDCST